MGRRHTGDGYCNYIGLWSAGITVFVSLSVSLSACLCFFDGQIYYIVSFWSRSHPSVPLTMAAPLMLVLCDLALMVMLTRQVYSTGKASSLARMGAAITASGKWAKDMARCVYTLFILGNLFSASMPTAIFWNDMMDC